MALSSMLNLPDMLDSAIILNDLQGKKFDIAILQIGANDIIRFTPFKEIENNLQQVLRLTRQIAKKIILFNVRCV